MENKKVIVLEACCASDFENECNKLVSEGYGLATVAINSPGSAGHALGKQFQAVLAKPEALAGYIEE